VLDGEFYGGNKVKVDDSNWEIENVAHLGRCCVVTLIKAKSTQPGGSWEYVLQKHDVPPDLTITQKVSFDERTRPQQQT